MKLRVARHTDNLAEITSFYINILGFEKLGFFEDHAGYNGIFIGNPKSDWHFEFTQSDDNAIHHTDEDDIIVLYPETMQEFNTFLQKLSNSNVAFLVSKNPYWNENGKLFKDPDGFNIIISPLKATS